ncbi:MAG: MATE family efflux transporter, partial [Novosphingobium sp.]|nr:MATE family efflux transporter [Novosphingobium sp.]
MLTNVATALFGLADMWVIGRLGDAAAQGAVELGAKFMMGLLVCFNFLRTGTIALTAQSAGSGDSEERATTLARGVAVAVAIGVVLMLLRPLTVSVGLDLLEARGQVAADAKTYIDIRYWAATAWLINCVLIGWLIGQRRVRIVLVIEIVANVVHIALDLALVLLLGWGVAGVAVATVSSELLKLAVVGAIVAADPAARQAASRFTDAATWQLDALKRLFALNRDLFLRTLLLTGAMLILARGGAQQGPVILAANGILFQLFMLSTLILDGFENAAQVLCGEARGARDHDRFRSALRANLLWGWLTGAAICLAYLIAGGRFAMSFSTDAQVAQTALSYAGWVVLLPMLGVTSFVLDGVFV